MPVPRVVLTFDVDAETAVLAAGEFVASCAQP
jgi:hypothetical protein